MPSKHVKPPPAQKIAKVATYAASMHVVVFNVLRRKAEYDDRSSVVSNIVRASLSVSHVRVNARQCLILSLPTRGVVPAPKLPYSKLQQMIIFLYHNIQSYNDFLAVCLAT